MNIPKQQINWLVGRMHVSRPNDEVRADIKTRCTASGWTPEAVAEAQDYAIQCHDVNRLLYRDVTSGRL